MLAGRARRPRDIAAEHQTIAHLTVARVEVGATQALREHIQRTTTAALVRYAEQLDGIDDERALAESAQHLC